MKMTPEQLYTAISNLQNSPAGMKSVKLNADEIRGILSGTMSFDDALATKVQQAPGGESKSGMVGTGAQIGAGAVMGLPAAGPLVGGPLLAQAIGGNPSMAQPFTPETYDSPVLRRQIPGWETLTPEAKAKVLTTAKLAGFLPSVGGGELRDGQTVLPEGKDPITPHWGLNLPTEQGKYSKGGLGPFGGSQVGGVVRPADSIMGMEADPRLKNDERQRMLAFQQGVQQIMADPANKIAPAQPQGTVPPADKAQAMTTASVQGIAQKLPGPVQPMQRPTFPAGTGVQPLPRPTPGNLQPQMPSRSRTLSPGIDLQGRRLIQHTNSSLDRILQGGRA